MTITREAGKAVSFSRVEVARSLETFKFAADEARRLSGELIPFDAAATGSNRFGYFKKYPIGVVAAITPFNFPLNLVAHKVAPAIASGCPIVLKPASATPLTSIKLVELLLEAGLPPGGINLLVGPGNTVGEAIACSDRVSMISFTGSSEVGFRINQKAGLKKVVLEMGNNSAVIIHKDADISTASEKCLLGAFAYSGQVCISVQRIYIHESRYEEFRKTFLNAVNNCAIGDPEDENTIVGPMIHESQAIRIEQRIDEAKAQGATVSVGGKREGKMFEPTVLENCNQSMKVVSEEAFAPVVCLMKYKTLSDAFEMVNASKYGLQAGIFTNDINSAFNAIDALQVGGVMINETPAFRVDQMPYGGVKLSGLGREGAKYAVDEMTEMKTVMFNLN
jgi:acyl-CoA reductase-like NAD-dependent aldehyde dehydrogenase